MNFLPRAFLAVLALLAAALGAGQRLEPYDAFRIDCPAHPGLNGIVVLGASGSGFLPSGEAVVLAGLPLDEIQVRLKSHFAGRLAAPLGAFRLLRVANPQAPVRYLGALSETGETFATKGLLLSEVLRLARPNGAADLDAVEIRNWDGTKRVAARNFGNAANWDIELKPGDRVFVPEKLGGLQVYVLGAVARPGAVDFEPGMTAKAAVGRAGGARPEGDEKRVEVRRGQELLGLLDLALGDAPLEPGDVVHLHRKSDPDYIYVTGMVARPNRYSLASGMTLLQAIEGAGGMPLGIRKPTAVLLRTTSGKTDRLTFDLSALQNGKVIDPRLVRGDRIEVLESRA